MASLREVAQQAGVSLATASRVASGSVAVRQETRERVEEAMRELLYVPPGRKPATGAIGLLVPELSNPVFPALAQAMEARATEAGLATILCNTTAAAFREADYVHMLLERRVDGMIFISCEMTHLAGDHEHYGRLVDEGARLVFVNGALDGLDVPCVSVDERHAGFVATQHLIALGHERIGFVAGPADYLPTREKAAGRDEALRQAGLNPDGLVAHGDFTLEGGRRALRQLLAKPNRPTAVICSSDVIAIGVVQEAREAGLDVPCDLSVVGFDGIEAAGWVDPPLTTIAQPIEQIAATAVDLLLTVIDDPRRSLPRVLFQPKLRRGRSTAVPAANGAGVGAG
ncbi:MAG TPA: LacI family DNA-binding transcriptional regulator [Gaiellaceae bacterium]|nr:LacI family DNA-binding transcriptional regulator [Gaiellaceae bacterium]